MKTPCTLGFLLPALICLLGAANTQPAPPQKAAVVFLSGEVNDYTARELIKRFDEAKALGAKVIILRIDTYGGMTISGLDIARFLRDQTDVHTIAYVKNKAISAGAMIAVAADEIVMSPGSQLGDCAPIQVDQDGHLVQMAAPERAKAQSPVLADFAASASRNGYDPLVVEAMVRVETVVHIVVNDKGEKRYVDDKDYASLITQGWKPMPGVADPVDGADTLLTVGPEIAADLGLSKGIEPDVETLAKDRNLNIVADLSPGIGDSIGGNIIELLSSPYTRMLLFICFITSLQFALQAPGHGLAEAAAVLSLALLLGVPMLTGYAQWWEIVVILIGLALCAFEIFVFPGHGVSLVLGILMVIVGLVMTFIPKEPAGPGWLPTSEQTWAGLRTGLMVVLGGLFCSMLLSIWLRRYLPSIPYFKRLILTETSGNRFAIDPSATHPDTWPFVGAVGEAVTELKPGGSARFPFADDTRTTSVISSSGFLPPGSKVAVQEVRGSRVVVQRIG